MRKEINLNEYEKIFCKDISSISSYKDKILFRKHTHKINHVDLQQNLLMTSGDDDLIIIIDLAELKYIIQYYDIINGTSFCTFLEPPTSTRIIYYGRKSYKLYILDYIRNEIILIVNLLRENLYHLEYNGKPNLLITAQETNCIVWKLNENNLKANHKISNSYYAIVNPEKKHIISLSEKYNDDIFEKSLMSIYSYDNNRELTIVKERDVNYGKLYYHVNLMNFYKNNEHYYVILMSDFDLDIVLLDDDTMAFHLNLNNKNDLKFSYFEPTFTQDIIIGFNNGDVDVFNPNWDKYLLKKRIDDKYKKKDLIIKLIKEIKNNEPRHEESVVQIKFSYFYPLFVSIADEMIIYQLKE